MARPFLIKTRFEAYGVIYALAVGAVGRGIHYLHQFPGTGGYIMFAACTIAVFMAGGKILDGTRPPRFRQQSFARTIGRARQG